MKRIGAILLALCLIATGSALAELAPVSRSDMLAAYSDGQGKLYIPGRDRAVNSEAAAGIISIDNYRLAYLTENGDNAGDLRVIDLDSLEDSLAVAGVRIACLLDDSLYFVPDGNRDQLKALKLDDMSVRDIYAASEAIERLYACAEGMAFGLVDQAGNYLYDPATDSVEAYAGQLPRAGMLMDGYEVYMDDAGDLYMKDAEDYDITAVASDVTAFTAFDGIVYYLTDDGSAQRLMRYDPSLKLTAALSGELKDMEGQLTATDNAVFTLTTSGDIFRFDPDELGDGELLARYGDLSAYTLPEGTAVSGLRIEGMPGCLNVYAVLEDDAALPDFTFIEFEAEADAAEPALFLLDSIAMKDEDSAWDALMPAEQYTTLARGSRGEAVRAIQQPLYDLGYYDYYVDGIFGPRTQWAIRLLQADLNLPDNGIADAALQRTILSGTLSAYDPFVPLPRGSRGLRVQIMQQRLRDLGYLADAADRIYGGRTQKAVQLFQKENGIDVSDRATRATLKRLYSDIATPCSSYIDLYPGDTGYRVRALNNRLRELYYLESSIGSVYTDQTASAVRVFQRTAGLTETGEATMAVQQRLFADDAPEAPGYILLRRGDSNARVKRLQQRLKELGYFNGKATGYFGRVTQSAVALFQKKVKLKATGVATVRTQQLLFDEDAPEYVKPSVIDEPVIALDSYEYEDGGIYYIADDSAPKGYVVFDWYAEGDVANYSVVIEDSKGNICLDQETLLTRTGVSVSTLRYNRVYTLTVTAWPEDGDESHSASASLRFARIKPEPAAPEVGKIGNPVLKLKTVARVENGINYVMPGELTLKWHADGQVDHYRVSVLDESDSALLEIGSTDKESTALDTDQLTQGEVYTLYVYAVPTNGTMEHARMRSMRFALPVVELPEPEPEPEPEPGEDKPSQPVPLSITKIEFDNIDHEYNGITYLTGEPIVMRWSAEGSVGKYNIQLTGSDDSIIAAGDTIDTALSINRAKLKSDVVYTLKVTAIPVNGTADDGVYTTAQFALFTPAVEEVPTGESDESESGEAAEEPAETGADAPDVAEGSAESGMDGIGIPELAFSPSTAGEGDITYVEGDIITLSWNTEGDVQAYDVKILDDSGTQCAATTTDRASLNIRAANLAPNEVYTLVVTATPADSSGERTEASARFALYVENDAAESGAENAEAAEPEEDMPEDASAAEHGDEPPAEAAEAEDEPIQTLPAPEIGFDPVASMTDGIAYVSGDAVVLRWRVDGAAKSYNVSIADGSGNIMASTNTEKESLKIRTNGMAPGEIYTLFVTALSDDDVQGETGSARFTLYAEQEAAPVAPAEESEDASDGAETDGDASADSYEAADSSDEATEESHDEPEEAYEAPEEEAPEETYEAPEETDEAPEESYDEPEDTVEAPDEVYEEPEPVYEEPEESAPSYAPVTQPSIGFDPVVDTSDDGTAYLEGDAIALYWQSEGDVRSYAVSVTDSSGNEVASAETEDTGISLSSAKLVPGEIYTLRVTANPMDSDSDSATASARFALYAEAPADPPAEDASAEEYEGEDGMEEDGYDDMEEEEY